MRKPTEWWDRTWNPFTGCTRVSAGCANCYAHEMHRRFGAVIHGVDVLDGEGDVRPFRWLQFHPDRLDAPCHWRRPRVVFVGSMTDMFHERVEDLWFLDVFDAMDDAPQHTYVILTKRPERIDHMIRLLGDGFFPPSNWYIGVSVEDQETANARIPALIAGWPGPKIVSYEPALGPVDLLPLIVDSYGPLVTGVIAGAETGPRARIGSTSFRAIRDDCAAYGIPFFLKQVNARRERALDGRTHDDLPWVITP